MYVIRVNDSGQVSADTFKRDYADKIFIAYEIVPVNLAEYNYAAFLISVDGNPRLIPLTTATIIRASLTPEIRADWADVLRIDAESKQRAEADDA